MISSSEFFDIYKQTTSYKYLLETLLENLYSDLTNVFTYLEVVNDSIIIQTNPTTGDLKEEYDSVYEKIEYYLQFPNYKELNIIKHDDNSFTFSLKDYLEFFNKTEL